MNILQKIDKKIEDTKIGDATITIKEYEEIKALIKDDEKTWIELCNIEADRGFKYATEQRERMTDIHERSIDILHVHLSRKHLEEIESNSNLLTLSLIIITALGFFILGILSK
jgi:hypothetical protein